ncbi:patatin-like phospholipase family protein [Ramlibacter solisilvae]|uniref:patatin-like phospholipase family protein n=1 Tax=Ramlibacter tataouinensis TaxID=94132 RepID=UPI000776FDAB|nr:patatin-like phospholipase family protein [Ramlibacter tataouinensis]
MDNNNVKRKRVALVIGAGSVKCAAALGLWRVLQREGIELSMVVGASGGSIYAASMAIGHSVDESTALTQKLWTQEISSKTNWRGLLAAFMPRLFGFDGGFALLDEGPIERALNRGFGDVTFADAKLPLYIVATDMMTGERVVLKDGRIADCIRASTAIPYVWKPFEINGRRLLDGCVSDPMPVAVAMQEGADVILTMGFESPYPNQIRSASRYAFHMTSVYTNNLLRANFAFDNLAHHTEIIPILPNFDRPVRLFDTHLIPYVIEEGERAAEDQLPYLKRLLEEHPVAQAA